MEGMPGGALSLGAVQATVIQVRGKAVILDEDLAQLRSARSRTDRAEVSS